MVLRFSGVLPAVVLLASVPALAQDLETASSLDYAEVLEGRDGGSLADSGLAEVGDDHPLIKRARQANPGKEIVVCMAGCSRQPGGAVFTDKPGAAKARKAERIGSPAAASAPPAQSVQAPAAIPTSAVADAVPSADLPMPGEASETAQIASRLSAISHSAAGIRLTRGRNPE